LLVTAYVGLVLWSILLPKSSQEDSMISLKSSYDQYVTKEYPKREKYFLGLAEALSRYTSDVPAPTADVLKYLGKPDLIDGTVEKGTLVYLYGRSGFTNRWVAYAFVTEGKLMQIGFAVAAGNDLSGFRAYSPQ
jgi:hypothetical protein